MRAALRRAVGVEQPGDEEGVALPGEGGEEVEEPRVEQLDVRIEQCHPPSVEARATPSLLAAPNPRLTP